MHLSYLLLHMIVESVTVDEAAPSPRLCRLKIWPDFPGYGFHLKGKKGSSGQFISVVDDNSPAQAAGLIQGDRLIEVNNIPIHGKEHNTVVQLIKANPTQTSLLVVDPDTFDYYRERGIIVNGDMSNVMMIECPSKRKSTKTPLTGNKDVSVIAKGINSNLVLYSSANFTIQTLKPFKMPFNMSVVEEWPVYVHTLVSLL